MQESPSSRRVDFDDDVTVEHLDDVTVEHLKRSHPLRSSFLHGDPDKKKTRSSSKSPTESKKKSSSRKSTLPVDCPVHGKKVTINDGSIPDVVIPLSVSRQNSSEESIGIQSIPLKSALKDNYGAGVQKHQGWAGLKWALLVGCYALMLLLAVVVGVVLIHQHRQGNSADSLSGSAFPTQLNEGSNVDLPLGPQQGPGLGIQDKPTQVSPNQIRKTKSPEPPSRNLRGKSIASHESSSNTFGSQPASRRPKIQQAGIPVFPIQQSSQPSLTGHQSRQPRLLTNQGSQILFNNRGTSASQLPTRSSPFPGNRTRGSSLSRQQLNQQTFIPQNIANRGSLPQLPIRQSSFPGDQTQSSSFPASSQQTPNHPSSPIQQRNKPPFPIQRSNQSRQPVSNTRRPSSQQQQPNMQASQLPFNTNPSTQPHFPFEQLHRSAGNTKDPGDSDPEVKISQLWNHQNSDGSFTYGYVNTDGSFKNETRGIGGCVEGIYGYVDPVTNQQIRVPYQTGNTPGRSCNDAQPAWPSQTG